MLSDVMLQLAAVACALGQTGYFGVVTTRLKSGDSAPDLTFAKILNAPAGATSSLPNLSGQVTVVVFFPDTSHNIQAVTRWNALAAQFAEKPVQFVWITGEKDSSLLPWLVKHPLKSWVLHDPDGSTGRAYGMEMPAAAIIGPDRAIVGFDQSMVPQGETLQAVLEGRITTISPKRGEFKAFAEKRLALLSAQPPRMPRGDENKPDLPPSLTLYVSPSQSENGGDFSGNDYFSLQRLTLKDAIARVEGIDSIRIDLPASLDDGKLYDFSLVLPESASGERRNELFLQGIRDHFHIELAREKRTVDAYVLTASDSKLRARKPQRGGQNMSFSRSSSVTYHVRPDGANLDPDGIPDLPAKIGLDAVHGLSATGSLDEVCATLEFMLDRPVVNETGLKGEFAIEVKGDEGSFQEKLHEQTGLTVATEPRTIELLVIKLR